MIVNDFDLFFFLILKSVLLEIIEIILVKGN